MVNNGKYLLNVRHGDFPAATYPGGNTKEAAAARAETRLQSLLDEGYVIDEALSDPKRLDWTLTLRWTGETARVYVTEAEAVTA